MTGHLSDSALELRDHTLAFMLACLDKICHPTQTKQKQLFFQDFMKGQGVFHVLVTVV